MTDKEKISVSIHDTLVNVINTLTLPTHKTLMKTFKWSAAITGITLLSSLLGFYTFISWQGALLCTCMLLIFMYAERRNNDELLRMYGSAKLRAEEALCRAKDTSTSHSSGRVTNNLNKSKETSE